MRRQIYRRFEITTDLDEDTKQVKDKSQGHKKDIDILLDFLQHFRSLKFLYTSYTSILFFNWGINYKWIKDLDLQQMNIVTNLTPSGLCWLVSSKSNSFNFQSYVVKHFEKTLSNFIFVKFDQSRW